MRGIMRMLMMFGPMIYKQYQKYQRNKSVEKPIENMNRQNSGEKNA